IDSGLWSVSASFVDYDRDGRLDIYVADYLLDPNSKRCLDMSGRLDYCGPTACPPAPDKLFHNEGQGRFRDVSKSSGIASVAARGLGVVCADLNGDGWDDIYVANDADRNFLWMNQRDGTFEDAATVLGCAYNRDGSAEAGMGIAIGDVDGDGELDLFVTHLRGETNTFYRAGASGSFQDATDASGLGLSSIGFTGFGTGLIDFDHDADLDLVIVNGAVKRRSRQWPDAATDEFWKIYAEPNLLYVNDGTGRFRNASKQAGPMCGRAEVSRGLAVGDFDGDGDLDLVMTHGGGPGRLFRNDMPKQGRWLMVRAVDPELNRDALGAVVKVSAGGRTLQRIILSTFSYASTSAPVAHFGLGSVDRVDEVTVRWPDGMRERFAGPPLDRVVELRRGTGQRVEPVAEAGS
ncbi:MAG: CRTAC1 family protein, partial [Planctomycetota bacterium]